MLSIPTVINRSLPYGSIITRILRYFHVPITEPVYVESRKLGREIISAIKFFKKHVKWVKTQSSKNEDTLVAPEDDRMLNDIYSEDDRMLNDIYSEDDRMLNDIYSEDELPYFRLGGRPHAPRRAAAIPSQDEEPAEPAVPPASSSVSEDHFQQLFDKVDALSQLQQQLQSDFATFQQQILDQQMELLAGQHRILGHLGYDPGRSSS